MNATLSRTFGGLLSGSGRNFGGHFGFGRIMVAGNGAQAVEMLKVPAGGQVIAGVTDVDIALQQAGENLLSGALLQDLGIVLRPLTGAARSFFVYWARRFELFNLKSLIRGKLRGLPASEIEGHLELTPNFAVLPKERLLQTEDVAELLRQIEAGPYGSIARQARRALEEHQDNLAAETAIDRRYFQGLLLQTRLLPDDERKAVAKAIAKGIIHRPAR